MVGLQIVVTWLHVLGGIFWFGGTLYAGFVLGPAVMSLPPQTSRALYNAMMARRTPTVIEVVGVLTILLGIVRGTLLGPVRTLEFLFGTSYGITWGIALLLGLSILAWSRFVVGPQSDRMQAAIEMGDAAALRGAMPLLLVELLGFFAIFTCMILMRFGL